MYHFFKIFCDAQALADSWGVSELEATSWYEAVVSQSYYAREVWMTLPMFDELFFAVSTEDSCRKAIRAWHLDGQKMRVSEPEWYFWEVFGSHYSLKMHPGGISLSDLLDVLYGSRWWRLTYGEQWAGPYWSGLRECLLAVGIQWREFFASRSLAAYRCLDLYVCDYPSNASGLDAQYLVGLEVPLARRWAPQPEDWWHYPSWYAYAQGDDMSEYDFDCTVFDRSFRSRL